MKEKTNEDDEKITVKDVMRAFVFGGIVVPITLVNPDFAPLLAIMAGFLGLVFLEMAFMVRNEPTQTTLEDFDSSL